VPLRERPPIRDERTASGSPLRPTVSATAVAVALRDCGLLCPAGLGRMCSSGVGQQCRIRMEWSVLQDRVLPAPPVCKEPR
jgi:hypothetical protein